MASRAICMPDNVCVWVSVYGHLADAITLGAYHATFAWTYSLWTTLRDAHFCYALNGDSTPHAPCLVPRTPYHVPRPYPPPLIYTFSLPRLHLNTLNSGYEFAACTQQKIRANVWSWLWVHVHGPFECTIGNRDLWGIVWYSYGVKE